MQKLIFLLFTALCLFSHVQAQGWPVIPSPSVVNTTGGVINQSGAADESVSIQIVNSANTSEVLMNSDVKGGQENHWTFAGMDTSKTFKLQVRSTGGSGTFDVKRVQIGLFRLY